MKPIRLAPGLPPSLKRKVNSWCLYDWANSAFATTMMAAVLPIFFRTVGASTLAPARHYLATTMWGYTAAAATLLTAVLSLLLGPAADISPVKKRFLLFFLLSGALAAALTALTGPGDWIWISVLFIIGSLGFTGSEIFYDSLLPHLVPPRLLNTVSTRGYAAGYLGGGILLLFNILLINFLPGTPLEPGGAVVPLTGMRLSFVSVALWWLVFSVPLFRTVPEPRAPSSAPALRDLPRIALLRLRTTLGDLTRYRHLFRFLVAFWFYNDGIGTIIKMAVAYGDEIGISTIDLVGALLLTQAVGIPFTLLFGRLADAVGVKKGLSIGLLGYTAISVFGFFITRSIHFWLLALAVGMVQGGTQALSRSLYGAMVPKSKAAEFFSFYHISGKFAGVAGPAVFALVSQTLGNSRFAILSLVVFFAAGLLILSTVDVDRGRMAAAGPADR